MKVCTRVILTLTSFLLFSVHGQLKLTPEERKWLTENPVIKVANEDDWPPFDYSENGRALGLTISYVDVIAKKLGIKKYQTLATWVRHSKKTSGKP